MGRLSLSIGSGMDGSATKKDHIKMTRLVKLGCGYHYQDHLTVTSNYM